MNGRLLGAHRNPWKLERELKTLRRARKFGKYIAFIYIRNTAVYISSDAGRVCRPLIIVENGVSKLRQEHIERIKDPNDPAEFANLIDMGVVEFIDVNEENNCYVAIDERYFNETHTHGN